MKNSIKWLSWTCYTIGIAMLIAGGVFDVQDMWYFYIACAFIFVPWVIYLFRSFRNRKENAVWLLFGTAFGHVVPSSAEVGNRNNDTLSSERAK